MGNGFSFQNLLHYNFIYSKKYQALGGVEGVAERMKIHKDTLYKYISGALAFPIDRLGDLVAATEDEEYYKFFADKTGHLIVPSTTEMKSRKTSHVLKALGDLISAVLDSNEKEKR
jgi:hypothetical protein